MKNELVTISLTVIDRLPGLKYKECLNLGQNVVSIGNEEIEEKDCRERN